MERVAVLVGMLVAASVGDWTDEAKEGLHAACLHANAGEDGAERFCACLVREVPARVTQAEFEAYTRPEPAESDLKVYTLGREAVRVCLEGASRGGVDI